MTDDAKQAILAELERYVPIAQAPREGDLTIEDAMRLKGMSRNAASDWLGVLVKAGRLVKLAGISPETGKRVNLYRKVEV